VAPHRLTEPARPRCGIGSGRADCVVVRHVARFPRCGDGPDGPTASLADERRNAIHRAHSVRNLLARNASGIYMQCCAAWTVLAVSPSYREAPGTRAGRTRAYVESGSKAECGEAKPRERRQLHRPQTELDAEPREQGAVDRVAWQRPVRSHPRDSCRGRRRAWSLRGPARLSTQSSHYPVE
jgi:hypothetical protein